MERFKQQRLKDEIKKTAMNSLEKRILSDQAGLEDRNLISLRA